ncbi:glycoside hydrolase family 97 protein [Amycolatopsis nigrescens]|uniref:glycoside hydrolase family 97 protein n=1 Tax=Amycolatopsis nigrescens TaxID=381445 RepID=UPI000372DF86|nr:glycoside hydrolase family 97 protein [Amycolatopsis nigrescens]
MKERVMFGCAVVVGAVLVGVPDSGQASPAESWTLSAPGVSARAGGTPEAQVSLDDGRLTLSVRRGATTVLERSALGVETAHGDFTAGLSFAGMSQRHVQESYQTKTGRRLEHSLDAAETTLHLRAGGQPMDVVFRVAADGVAYRYVFPGPKWVTVVREASEFAVPVSADSFLLPYDNGRSDYESAHAHKKVGEQQPAEYGYPSLFHVGDSWLSILESDLDGRYGGSRLTLGSAPGRFRLTLPDPTETSAAPLATPWRTMIVGDLATVTESDLVTDLAEPSKVADTSWIKPGVAAWSWWADGGSPGSLEKQKEYVDYAAKQGWEYSLVDSGWNAAWVPELVEYARQRGVAIWLWLRWQQVDTDSERERLFAQYRDWGVVGLKIDFVESDGQDRMRWYDGVLAASAKYRLMLNFHGAPIPRGTERTWPQVLSVEAVKGAEGTRPKPGREPFPIEHYLTLPFTRNLTGPMDFTPVTFSGVRPNSDAAELALSVVYESGAQHFADSPATYARYPLAEQLLRAVPTVWDETKLLDGDPGRLAVLARRSGSDWYVGAITAGEAGQVRTGLGFLPAGAWNAELYTDGADGKLTFSTQRVDSGSTLTVPVTRNGGFSLRITPAH